MGEHVEIRWIRTGIVGGVTASVLYPALLFAPFPFAISAAVASFLGPAIGLGSLGLYRLIRLHAQSVVAALGALIFGRFCLGSYVYHLVIGEGRFASRTLPWSRPD